MNERAFVTLKRNKELLRYIEAEARRHFGQSEKDREDAAAEAWERIWKQPAGLRLEEYKRHADNAISGFYSKVRRRKVRYMWHVPGKPGMWLSRATAVRKYPDDIDRIERVTLPDVRIDADPEGISSPGLAQLAQKAIDGDW